MTARIKIASLALLALFVISVAAAPARADLIRLESRIAFSGQDLVTWESLGDPNGIHTYSDTYAFIYSPATTTSTPSGLGVTISTTSLGFMRTVQPSNGGTNFTPGDILLWPATGYDGYHTTAPITISFASPVYAIGTQIASDDFLGFTASIAAYNNSSGYLGTVSRNGYSTPGPNNSTNPNLGSYVPYNPDYPEYAIFLGFSSDLPVDYIIISCDRPGSTQSFAINQLSVATTPVPLPGGLLLLAAGCGRLLAHRARQQRRRQPSS